MAVIELTCPWEVNLENAIQRKSNRYAPLINDISLKSFIVECFPLEFGARGIVNEETITELSELCTEHVQ